MAKALVEFHYAADGRNPVRHPAGADVAVRPEHIDALVAEGKIDGGAATAPAIAPVRARPKAKRGRRT